VRFVFMIVTSCINFSVTVKCLWNSPELKIDARFILCSMLDCGLFEVKNLRILIICG
jgi:hypothetical protein